MKQNKTDSNVQRQIDENLRRVYGDMVNEEIPDRLSQLLKQLKEGAPANNPNKGPDQGADE